MSCGSGGWVSGAYISLPDRDEHKQEHAAPVPATTGSKQGMCLEAMEGLIMPWLVQ